jgi:signal recognition particle GTPase
MAGNMEVELTFCDHLRSLERLLEGLLAGKVPGFPKAKPPGFPEAFVPDKESLKPLRRKIAIIYSMTPRERQMDTQICQGRRLRIAEGAGIDSSEVVEFLNGFDKMKETMNHAMDAAMGAPLRKDDQSKPMPRRFRR